MNEDYYIGNNGEDYYYIDGYGHLQKEESDNNLFEPSLSFFSLSMGLSYRF